MLLLQGIMVNSSHFCINTSLTLEESKIGWIDRGLNVDVRVHRHISCSICFLWYFCSSSCLGIKCNDYNNINHNTNENNRNGHVISSWLLHTSVVCSLRLTEIKNYPEYNDVHSIVRVMTHEGRSEHPPPLPKTATLILTLLGDKKRPEQTQIEEDRI